MKIGVDIDEVIKDTLDSVIEFYYQKTGKRIPRDDFKSYRWWEVWGIEKKEAIKIWNDFVKSDLHKDTPMIKGSKEAIEILDKNHDILFITSRADEIEKETREWFKIHFPNKNFKIHFTSYIEQGKVPKSDICIRQGVEILIEDDVVYSEECAEKGIKVILFDKPWNQGLEHKKIIRVENWSEALEEIEEIVKNN